MSSEFSTTCKIGERFQSPSRPVAQSPMQSPRSTTVKERNRGTAMVVASSPHRPTEDPMCKPRLESSAQVDMTEN